MRSNETVPSLNEILANPQLLALGWAANEQDSGNDNYEEQQLLHFCSPNVLQRKGRTRNVPGVLPTNR